MEIVLTIVFGVLGLCTVVTIHEFGHFLAAKLFKIEIVTFSVGWGPRLFGFKHKGTDYRISALPIGGFCRMKGEEDLQSAIMGNKEFVESSKGSFYAARPWQRIIVSLAGPLFNLITAIVLLTFLSMPAQESMETLPYIGVSADYPILNDSQDPIYKLLYSANSPAVKAGLKTNDLIFSINGKVVRTFREISVIIGDSPQETLALQVWRNNQLLDLKMTPLFDSSKRNSGMTGIQSLSTPLVYATGERAQAAGIKAGDLVSAINGQDVQNNIEVDIAMRATKGPVSITVQRDGGEKILTLYPKVENDYPVLDVSYKGILIKTPARNFGDAFVHGWDSTFKTLWLIVRSLRYFGMGMNPTSAVSGPGQTIASIGQVTTGAIDRGIGAVIFTFLQIIALISIALCFGNLLPIPALDGGQIVLCVAEIIKRKPIRLKTIKIYNTIGLVMVLGLLVLAMFGDLKFFNLFG